jgi:hypothetical protein
MRAMRSALVLAVALLCSCGGGGKTSNTAASASTPNLADDRPLVGAGARCSGASCTCRQVDASGNTIAEDTTSDEAPAGTKRFELRTGRGSDEVKVTVEGRGTLHKASDSIDMACGYVDLPPGEHRVRLRVKAAAGQPATPRLLIYERGAATKSWYHSFEMTCGSGATCNRPELEDRLAELRKPRGLFDPCGSVKVKGLKHDSQRDAEDRITELDLEFTLKVYDFEPRFKRGGQCKGLPKAQGE